MRRIATTLTALLLAGCAAERTGPDQFYQMRPGEHQPAPEETPQKQYKPYQRKGPTILPPEIRVPKRQRIIGDYEHAEYARADPYAVFMSEKMRFVTRLPRTTYA